MKRLLDIVAASAGLLLLAPLFGAVALLPVGPRPEAPRYVEAFHRDYEEILVMRPGLTDMASLKYRDESALLGRSSDPEQEYLKRVLPDKIRLAKEYIRRSSLTFDLALIAKTFHRIIFPGSAA